MNYKKTLLFFFISIAFTTSVHSQSSFKAIYKYIDTGNHTDTEYILYYNNGVSKYVTHKKKETRKKDNFEFKIPFVYYEFYYNLNKNICYQYRVLSDEKTSIKAEWKKDIKWRILGETKKIGRFTVQKAISDYLTKDFPDFGNIIAWFTTEIPIGTGPDKYIGLPGLIIKIEFENYNQLTYELKSIEFEEQENIIINTKGIKVSKDEMLKPWIINKKWLRKQKKEFVKKND
tara:strand:- start:2007 stop:2699 length:693 start_codon:yes stop_codon:yes gene_type:complete